MAAPCCRTLVVRVRIGEQEQTYGFASAPVRALTAVPDGASRRLISGRPRVGRGPAPRRRAANPVRGRTGIVVITVSGPADSVDCRIRGPWTRVIQAGSSPTLIGDPRGTRGGPPPGTPP